MSKLSTLVAGLLILGWYSSAPADCPDPYQKSMDSDGVIGRINYYTEESVIKIEAGKSIVKENCPQCISGCKYICKNSKWIKHYGSCDNANRTDANQLRNDADQLANDLGLASDVTTSSTADLASDLTGDVEQWEAQQRQRQAIEEAERQRRANDEAERRRLEQEELSRRAAAISAGNNSSRWGGVLGSLAIGAAQGYVAGKYGAGSTTPMPNQDSSNTGTTFGMTPECHAIFPQFQSKMDECERQAPKGSICALDRHMARCMAEIEALSGNCEEVRSEATRQRLEYEQGARSICANP